MEGIPSRDITVWYPGEYGSGTPGTVGNIVTALPEVKPEKMPVESPPIIAVPKVMVLEVKPSFPMRLRESAWANEALPTIRAESIARRLNIGNLQGKRKSSCGYGQAARANIRGNFSDIYRKIVSDLGLPLLF
jgi:hypothetical protein